MKKKSLFMSLLAAMMFAGCSNEDVVEGPALPMTQDGTAYLSVRIASAPGTRGTDKFFEYGSKDEHDVTSADFYFYDAAGGYVAQAQVWKGGSANTGDPAKNIEYMGKNVVMLKGLKEKNFPKYVVTVLNQPTGFVPGKTLQEMETQLVDGIKSGDNFIMTTTSYKHGTAADGSDDKVGTQPTYFATEVTEANFVADPDGDVTATPVVIYVERLAAKVNLATTLTPVEGTTDTYQLGEKVTIGGSGNTENDDDNIGAEVVRVRFDGWGLNATAKQSHIVKNIDCGWNLGTFPWNETTYYRSLWGKGTAYGQDYSDSDDTYKDFLSYNSWDDMEAKVTKPGTTTPATNEILYCAENTNTVEKLEGHFGTVPTSVVIAATVLCKKADGTWGEGEDMVRYNGVLFKADAFKQYALNNLSALGNLNYYIKTTTTTADGTKDVYTQMDGNYVDVVKVDGETVKLEAESTVGTTNWFKKTGEKTYEAIPYSATVLADLNSALTPFVGNGFKGGKMYYNIPIEHLYNLDNALAEGEYGVVRNHYYKLNVNKLEKLGTGVWDPADDIVPGNGDDEYYQVGVEINILSWRVVSQGVEL